MKKITALCLFLIISMASVVMGAELPSKKDVIVDGIAAITGNVTTAKEAAITQAIRTAVEQAVGVYVSSETKVSNFQLISDQIYTKATGFASNWTVLAEKKDGDTYWVKVKVTVGVEPLTEELKKLGLLKKWKVAVLVNATKTSFNNTSPIITSINKIVEDTGFTVASPEILSALEKPAIAQQVVNGNYLPAIKILMENHIDLLITGKVSGDIICKDDEAYGVPIKMCSTNARFDASVVRADTAEILANASFTEKAAGNGKEKVQSDALVKLGDKSGNYFVKQMLRIPASPTVNLTFIVSGATFKRIGDFKNVLEKRSTIIRRISEVGFINGEMTYTVEIDGNASLFTKTLVEDSALDKFKIDIINSTSGKVEIKIK